MKVLIVLAVLASMACAIHGGVIAPSIPNDGIMPIDSESSENNEEQDLNKDINLGEALNVYLEEIRKAMPCGNEQLHLPKLAPIRVEHIALNTDDDELKVNGSISNLMVSGLNNFQFVGRSYEESNNFFTFDIIFPELSALAEYKMDTWFRVAGWPVSFAGEGLIDVKAVDFRMVGQFAITPYENGTHFTDLDFAFYLGDVVMNNWNNLWPASVNKFTNKFQSSLVMMLSEQLRNVPAELFREQFLPQINEMMSEFSVKDLIKFFTQFANTLKKAHCKRQ